MNDSTFWLKGHAWALPRAAALGLVGSLSLLGACSGSDNPLDNGTTSPSTAGPSATTTPSVGSTGTVSTTGTAGSTGMNAPTTGTVGTTTMGTTGGVPTTGTDPAATMGDGGVGVMPDGGTTTGTDPGGSEADFQDPGQGEWETVTPEECGLDSTKFEDSRVGNYAVFRYGKLCHMKGGDGAGSMFSATKTLGGATIGRAAYLTRDIPRTGPGTGTILHEDLATDWLGRVSYNAQATLAHVMAMCGHSRDLSYGSKTYSYDTIGSTQINTMMGVTEAAISQLDGVPSSFTAFMRQEIFDRLGMESSSYSAALGIASGWSANLSDMGRLGTLLVHDGYYGGERLISREWVYRMSHPAFEDANTSYGQLAWLNHRGNAAGIGGNVTSGANAAQGDPCAPAAFWPSYPHTSSGAPDCRAEVGTCEQQYDVGIFSGQGLNGQFLVMHPGLDMVIAARNFSGGDGPMGLWEAVRPALVAMDPMYQGDEAAFCEAYGSGNYAPDLVMARHP